MFHIPLNRYSSVMSLNILPQIGFRSILCVVSTLEFWQQLLGKMGGRWVMGFCWISLLHTEQSGWWETPLSIMNLKVIPYCAHLQCEELPLLLMLEGWECHHYVWAECGQLCKNILQERRSRNHPPFFFHCSWNHFSIPCISWNYWSSGPSPYGLFLISFNWCFPFSWKPRSTSCFSSGFLHFSRLWSPFQCWCTRSDDPNRNFKFSLLSTLHQWIYEPLKFYASMCIHTCAFSWKQVSNIYHNLWDVHDLFPKFKDYKNRFFLAWSGHFHYISPFYLSSY